MPAVGGGEDEEWNTNMELYFFVVSCLPYPYLHCRSSGVFENVSAQTGAMATSNKFLSLSSHGLDLNVLKATITHFERISRERDVRTSPPLTSRERHLALECILPRAFKSYAARSFACIPGL